MEMGTPSILPLCYWGGDTLTPGHGSFKPEIPCIMPVKLRFVVLLRLHYPDILEEWNPIIFALGQLRKQWKDSMEAQGRLHFASCDPTVLLPA